MTSQTIDDLVIYNQDGLVVVNKPAGYETISQTGGACLTKELQKKLNILDLEPAHRLDRDTTGVQVFCRNKTTLKNIEEQFRHRKTEKEYLAICSGIPRNTEGTINRNLSKWGGGRRPVQVVKGQQGLEAQTAYQLLARNKDFPASLILFKPMQGRTHQIRVHAEAMGRPILADDQYGDRQENQRAKDSFNLKRQALHAWRLILINPVTGEPQLFCAKLPQDMAHACDLLFSDWQQILDI